MRVLPVRTTSARTVAGPQEPGRRKKADTTSGSGNGSTRPSDWVHSASR